MIINFHKKDRPEPGRVYSLSAMMGKGKTWEQAEVKSSGIPLGAIVSYGDMANSRHKFVVIEEQGGMYGQKCIALDTGRESVVSLTSIDGPGGWHDEHLTLSTDQPPGAPGYRWV